MKAHHGFALFLLVFAAGVLFQRHFSEKESVTPSSEPPSAQVIPSPSVSSAAPITKISSAFPINLINVQSAPPHSSNKVNPRFTKKPIDLNVDFEVVNGLAVAYGDTVLGKPTDGFTAKNGITEMRRSKSWEGGVVPYSINSDVPEPARIKQAIDFFNEHTSVKFVPYEGQADAVVFQKGELHCYSYLGKMGGLQPLFLSDRCGPTQIMHEMMHVLGFIHEQSRIDRDQYVDVLWDNIEEQYQSQYAMVAEPFMENYFDSPFDPHSIMMYEPHAFSVKPGLETMKLKNAGLIEPSAQLSPSDIERINRLYHN